MARTAQDVLEFDKLRELLRLRTTCALGKRAVDALEPGTDQKSLEAAFAQIREAREWLRAGNELGFGGLADPQQWLEHIEGPGVVLDAAELLDAASLLETEPREGRDLVRHPQSSLPAVEVEGVFQRDRAGR